MRFPTLLPCLLNWSTALAIAIGLGGLVLPTGVRADSIVDVTMSDLTFSGNNACGPSGTSLCTQTLNVAFQWDNTTNTFVLGSLSFDTSGAIGTLFGAPAPVLTSSGLVFDSFTSGINFGDSMQFTIGETIDGLAPGVYNLTTNFISTPPGSWAAGLSCSESALGPPFPAGPNTPCGQAYYPPVAGLNTSNGAFASSGVVTVSLVSTPEPKGSALLGMGLLCLLGMALLRKRLASDNRTGF